MLTSLQNPLVKQMRKLHRTKERHKQNLFLLEGTHLLELACQVNSPLITLCFTASWQENHPSLCQEASQRAQRTELVSPDVLEAIATTVHPDGVVATMSREAVGVTPADKMELGIAVERLQDPGNLGTIIRTAAAANAEGLWLDRESVDVDHPKVLRASAGEWFRLPMGVTPDLKGVVQRCQDAGMQVVSTLPQASLTYWEVDFTVPTLILLGNEGAGLSSELVSLTDQQVRIPLYQGVESLNVAIAAALLLYEAQRQRNSS
ncbi:MAG: TrmH family RNA methyltransferase [Chroococcales cyanobacterium]